MTSLNSNHVWAFTSANFCNRFCHSPSCSPIPQLYQKSHAQALLGRPPSSTWQVPSLPFIFQTADPQDASSMSPFQAEPYSITWVARSLYPCLRKHPGTWLQVSRSWYPLSGQGMLGLFCILEIQLPPNWLVCQYKCYHNVFAFSCRWRYFQYNVHYMDKSMWLPWFLHIPRQNQDH